MSIFSLLATAALLAAAITACWPGGEARRTAGFPAVWPTGAAAILAGLGLLHALIAGTDGAGAALTLLVVALTVVVQIFAGRHLRGDPHARAFFAVSALVAAGSTVAATANGVVLLAAGWTLATIGMLALIGTGGRGPQTRAAVRHAAASLAIGDTALWAAVVIAVASTGSNALSALATLRDGPAVAVGALVAVAAISRAGSFPLHRWLASTAATTTPASALLHAGFVNAGALLLLRFSGVPSVVGPWIVGVAGGITMLAAAVAMFTRPDVKGRLVQSTAAQMGFMLVACALGAFGVALVHVIGHALFKASLFLGAGSAVERAVMARSAIPVRASRGGLVAGAGIVITAASVAIIAGDALSHQSAVLLLFVVATAAVAAAHIGAGRASISVRAILVMLITVATVGYVLVVFRGAEALVAVTPAAELSPLFAIILFAGACALAAVMRTSGRAADRLFAFAFSWGRAPLPADSRRAPRDARISSAIGGPLEYGRLS